MVNASSLAIKQLLFWNFLEGSRAEMFGVFTNYELQAIHCWIRANASIDGRAYAEPETEIARRPRHDFRAELSLATARGSANSRQRTM